VVAALPQEFASLLLQVPNDYATLHSAEMISKGSRMTGRSSRRSWANVRFAFNTNSTASLRIRPRLLKCRPLGLRTRELFNETNVPFRDLFKHRCQSHSHGSIPRTNCTSARSPRPR
jgi:hypothetical protein